MATRSSLISTASCLRVRSSASPEITIWSTSFRIVSSEIIGRSVSSGNVLMLSTLLFISFSACTVSYPISISRVTVQFPSLALDVILKMLSALSSASSIREQTPSSTSSGAAPRYGTLTCTIPNSTSGNSSWLSCVSAIRPPATKITISKFDATGLSMNQAITDFMSFSPLLYQDRLG